MRTLPLPLVAMIAEFCCYSGNAFSEHEEFALSPGGIYIIQNVVPPTPVAGMQRRNIPSFLVLSINDFKTIAEQDWNI